jgi:hypothetical protein
MADMRRLGARGNSTHVQTRFRTDFRFAGWQFF